MDVWIKGKTAEEFVTRILEEWARRFPERYRQYQKQVREACQQLYTSSGMSKEGLFQYRGEIPAELFIVIEKEWPGFFREPSSLLLIQRLLQVPGPK